MPITIETLTYRTAADLAGVGRDFARLDSMARAAAVKVERAFSSIRPPSIALPRIEAAGAGMGRGMGALSSSTLGAAASFGKLAIASAGVVGVLKTAEAGISFVSGGNKGASDLNEAINKTNVLLGDSAPAVKALADEFARDFGIVKADTLGVASALGALGKNAGGLSGDALGKFSTDLTRLAADVASIQNTSSAEIGKAFQVALSGEQSDVLKQLGVDTREAAVEQFALSRGLAKVGDKLTESQKVMARAGILTEKLSFASGDLARTINDPANAYRKFVGTVENLGASIGTALLPSASRALGLLNELATAADRAFQDRGSALSSVTTAIDGWIDTAGVFIRQWDIAFEITAVKAGAVAHNFGETMKAAASSYVEAMKALYDPAGGFGPGKGAAAAGAARFLGKPAPGAADAFKPAVDAFKPNYLDADKLIAPLAKKMADLESQRAAIRPGGAAAGAGPGGGINPPGPLIDPAQLDAMKKARAELEQFARSFRDDVRTPFEEFQAIVAKGREAFKAGLIKPEDFARLGEHALKESGLDEQLKRDGDSRFGGNLMLKGSQEASAAIDKARFAPAAELGSAEAVSAINRAMYGGTSAGAGKNKLAEDQKRLLGQILHELQSHGQDRKAGQWAEERRWQAENRSEYYRPI